MLLSVFSGPRKFSCCAKCVAEMSDLIWKIRMYWELLRKEEEAQSGPESPRRCDSIGRN